jgi:hypothetical protein
MGMRLPGRRSRDSLEVGKSVRQEGDLQYYVDAGKLGREICGVLMKVCWVP